MIIHLPEDLERSILAQVHRGRFASVDDAIAEAARLLLQTARRDQVGQDVPVIIDGSRRAGIGRIAVTDLLP